jgi:hypothetical protein
VAEKAVAGFRGPIFPAISAPKGGRAGLNPPEKGRFGLTFARSMA